MPPAQRPDHGPAQCRNGHPATPGARFCSVCGEAILRPVYCPVGHLVDQSADACPICAALIEHQTAKPAHCEQCNAAVAFTDRFCPSCGTRLPASNPAAPEDLVGMVYDPPAGIESENQSEDVQDSPEEPAHTSTGSDSTLVASLAAIAPQRQTSKTPETTDSPLGQDVREPRRHGDKTKQRRRHFFLAGTVVVLVAAGAIVGVSATRTHGVGHHFAAGVLGGSASCTNPTQQIRSQSPTIGSDFPSLASVSLTARQGGLAVQWRFNGAVTSAPSGSFFFWYVSLYPTTSARGNIKTAINLEVKDSSPGFAKPGWSLTASTWTKNFNMSTTPQLSARGFSAFYPKSTLGTLSMPFFWDVATYADQVNSSTGNHGLLRQYCPTPTSGLTSGSPNYKPSDYLRFPAHITAHDRQKTGNGKRTVSASIHPPVNTPTSLPQQTQPKHAGVFAASGGLLGLDAALAQLADNGHLPGAVNLNGTSANCGPAIVKLTPGKVVACNLYTPQDGNNAVLVTIDTRNATSFSDVTFIGTGQNSYAGLNHAQLEAITACSWPKWSLNLCEPITIPTAYSSQKSSGTPPPIGTPGLMPCVGEPGERPEEIGLACATYSQYLSNLNWSLWTSSKAVASGLEYTNSCTPTCVDGEFSHRPVIVTLSSPVATHFGILFSGIAISGSPLHYLQLVPGT